MRTESGSEAAEAQARERAPATAVPPSQHPERRRLAIAAGLGALFVVVTLVMAFPSIARWRTATPGDYGDSYLYQYLLHWDVHSMFSRSGSVFDATFYWPNRDTLLYSDTVLGVAPAAGALAAVVGWPIAFNLLYVAGWVASLASAYVLARWLRASREGAVLGAFVFSFGAVRLGHSGHFQLLFAFFIPLALWLLLRFLTEGRWWQALALGVSCGIVFLNAGYIAVVLYPALAVVAVGWLIASRFRPGLHYVWGMALAGATGLALTWPVLTAYRAQGAFLRRPYAHEQAVTLKSFLAPAVGSPLYGWLESRVHEIFEKRLFPGFLAMVLAVIGAVALVAARRPRRPGHAGRARRSRWSRSPSQPDLRRRGLMLVLLSTLPALILSFGKYQDVLGRRVTLPYSWVAGLPGFQTVRAFGRFTVVPLLAVGLLGAFGYDWLVRDRSHTTRLVAAVVLGVVMLAEYKAQVVMSDRIDSPRFATVNHALSRLPDAPVVELPMGDSRHFSWAYIEAPRMVLSAIDWKPRVGGYSGYSPPNYEHTIDLMNSLDDGGPASTEALDLIDELGVRYLVIRLAPVDETWGRPGATYEKEGGAREILASLPPERVEAVSREGAAVLVRLRPPPSTP